MLINTAKNIMKVMQQQANIKGSDGNITMNTQNKEKAAAQSKQQQLKTKQENTQYLKENIKQQKIDESQMKLTGNIIGEASYIFSSTFETPEGMKL